MRWAPLVNKQHPCHGLCWQMFSNLALIAMPTCCHLALMGRQSASSMLYSKPLPVTYDKQTGCFMESFDSMLSKTAKGPAD